MNAAGVTYFLAVCFWVLTAFYGVLSSQPFIEEHFLEPRLFASVATFADWHAAIGMVTLLGWSAARKRAFVKPISTRTWAAASGWLAATMLLAAAAPLSAPHTTTAALLTVGAGVFMILLLAVTDWRPFADKGANPSPDRSRADLTACVLAAVVVTVVHIGAATWVEGWSVAFGSNGISALRLHLLLAAGAFLVLTAIRGAAGLTPRPAIAAGLTSVAALAAVFAAFLSTVVLGSISIRGLLAAEVSVGLGVALAAAVAARGTSADGLLRALSALSPRIVARWWGFALWVACLLILAVVASTASRTADWNFVFLHSTVLLSWLLALSAALTFSHRLADGGAAGAFACVALLLGAHVALDVSVAPLRASSPRDASGKWIAEALAGTAQPPAGGDIVRFLHANTNIPRDTTVAAVDVDLAALTGSPLPARPHVFMLVVDSLRRDYLSPYNPAVNFTPALSALAHDSLVFRNAFTQYGATGLSVPSIWVGGPILHKQYVSDFPRMNTLAKLLAHEQYEQWLSMDHILDVILPDAANRTPLNAGVLVKNVRMCRTLAEIRSRLADRPSPAAPVFAYALPQDVHVSVVASEGGQSIDEGDYAGFYAPVASRVHRFDQCLGEFISDLKARGLYDQSVIIVTADHGDSLGEEGRMGHAYSLHPEVVRVPLIIHVPPDMRTMWTWDESQVAYSTDITPTLYRLLGHDPIAPAPFFGEPLARHAGTPPSQRDRMIAASYGAVYGALLDRASRYYVFDAVAMRDMAFELGSGATPGVAVAVSPDVRARGLKIIRDTVGAIGAFYRFPPPVDPAP